MKLQLIRNDGEVQEFDPTALGLCILVENAIWDAKHDKHPLGVRVTHSDPLVPPQEETF